MRENIGSWLSGPQSVAEGKKSQFPGENLGLPAHGTGSVASTGRRALALCIDWFLSVIVCVMVWGAYPMPSTHILCLWFIVCFLSVSLVNRTPGQILTGVFIASIVPGQEQQRIGVLRAFFRQVLLLPLLIPAFFQDSDGRGLHDRATGTIVLRG